MRSLIELNRGGGFVEPVFAERCRLRRHDRFGLKRAEAADETIHAREIRASLHRQSHLPLAISLGELQDAFWRRDREGVDLVAFDLEDGFVTQVEGGLVERRVDEAGDQEHALLIGDLRVQVSRGGGLAANLEPLLLAGGLEGDLDARLRQPVLRDVLRVVVNDPLELGVERLLVNPDTAALSVGAVTGSTICQSVPVFLSVVRSPDSDLMVISSILSASTLKTFSFFSASAGSRFDSTK